ncbi:MAG: tetraether lipid synthase Tes, partial [Candidatus Aenigmatarchaeota archaeon]
EKWEEYDKEGIGPEGMNTLPYYDSDLYDEHKSQSVLTNLYVTNRCNLRCSYCFANVGAEGFVYEPSLEEVRDLMKQVREGQEVPSKALQITGGEPTVRDDIIDIVEMAEEEGFTHIQLNTNGIKLSEDVEFCKKLREAGVDTVYMSFDGITEDSNPWVEQQKEAVENLREAGLGVVLVPVVIKGMNLEELPEIIKYARDNSDVVRGVNFQPVSFTGKITNISKEDRERERVDYTAAFEAIEEGTDEQITKDDWYPVPFVYPISKLVENVKGERQVEFTSSPKCGGATYVFIDDEGEMIPITRFIDVEGLMNYLDKLSDKGGFLKKIRISASLLRNLNKFIDQEKAPDDVNLRRILLSAFVKGDYGSLGKFHYNSLYIGSMWFQDAWNLNMDRLSRCVIHYTTPEGIVPFCSYNGLNVGQKIREEHSETIEEWEERTGKSIEDDLWENGPIS